MPDLQPVIQAYRDALPEGELVSFSLSPFDRLAVPNQTATFFPPDGRTRGGTGYGLTPDAALVSALGETTEEFAASRAAMQAELLEGSFEELRNKFGERGVCDPLTLCLEAGSDYWPQMRRRWMATKRLGTDEVVYVPVEFVTTYRGDIAHGDYQPLVTPITNGLGAGTSHEMALAHGLLELLQRDGNGLQIRALSSTTEIDPATVGDPEAKRLLERFDAAGVDVHIKVASVENGFVNLYVVGLDRDELRGGMALMGLAGGEASHPVASVALRKALLEWAASRARIAFMHGPLEQVARLTPPDYLPRMRAQVHPELEEPRALEAMKRWVGLPLDEVRREMARVLRVERRIPFSDLPSASDELGGNSIALSQEVTQRLQREGLDVLVADFSHAANLKGGVCALKVIVPILEVETLSYGRIGERNVQRLMSREDIRLAGVGRAPEGAKRVHLTKQAEERLGGQAWFDPRVQEEIVGPLYCFYREPGRHAAPLSLEREALSGE